MCFSSGPDTSSNYHPATTSLAASHTAVDRTATPAADTATASAKGGLNETTLAGQDPASLPKTTTPADSVAFSGTNFYKM